MVRFFVDEAVFNSEIPVLTDENFKHAKVLRLKTDEKIVLCDGKSNEIICVVKEIHQEYIELEILKRQKSLNEPKVKVSVYMALPKSDKFEHVIQKATELGAFEIVTFPTARCVSKLDEKNLLRKKERWQKIAESAAKQSMRGCIPEVKVLPDYKTALEEAGKAENTLLFYENENSVMLKSVLKEDTYKTISIITGPEGGFEKSEIDTARAEGVKVCSLGKRILRCETAPLCALSAIMYDYSEF